MAALQPRAGASPRRRPGAGAGPEGAEPEGAEPEGADQHRIQLHRPGAEPAQPELRGEEGDGRKGRGGRRGCQALRAAAGSVRGRSAVSCPAPAPLWSRSLGSGARPSMEPERPAAVRGFGSGGIQEGLLWKAAGTFLVSDVSVKALNRGVPFMNHDSMPSST